MNRWLGALAIRLPLALAIRLPLALAIPLLTVQAVGCGESTGHSASTVRDSSGVTIVESVRASWSADTRWRVAAEPVLSIGTADGAVEYQFDRVEGVVLRRDGAIVVADAGSSEIRFYDASGRFASKSGRPGEGPGEYQFLTSLGEGPGDSLWVYDFGSRRFTILTSDGRSVRTVSVGGMLSGLEAVGRTSDGSFLVREYRSSRLHEELAGLVRPLAAVAVLAPGGGAIDTIRLFPGQEVYIGTEDGRGVMSFPPYARSAAAARQGDDVWVGDQATYEIGLYDRSGQPLRLVRRLGLNLRLSQADLDRFIEAELAGRAESERQMLLRHYESLTAPESRPAYGRLLVDAEGHLWVSEWTSYRTQPIRWDVFARNGAYLGEVEVPERFRLFQVGHDRLVGVWRDELDVEQVRVHRIEKPGG